MSDLQGLFFWGFLVVFGVVMYLVSPRVKDDAGFFRGTTTVDYSRPFPVLTVALPAGLSQIDPAGMLVTGHAEAARMVEQ